MKEVSLIENFRNFPFSPFFPSNKNDKVTSSIDLEIKKTIIIPNMKVLRGRKSMLFSHRNSVVASKLVNSMKQQFKFKILKTGIIMLNHWLLHYCINIYKIL